MALHLNQQEIGYPYWFYVWKNYSELRGMLHFWVDSETKHFGYCNCLGHAPHVEKRTFCSSHWYLEDKKGWGGLQLHDYDELSMNYCNCMILYEQFVDHSDNEPWKTMFSPSLHAFFGIHITSTKAGDRVTHEMDCTLQWYAVVCPNGPVLQSNLCTSASGNDPKWNWKNREEILDPAFTSQPRMKFWDLDCPKLLCNVKATPFIISITHDMGLWLPPRTFGPVLR